MRCKLDFRSWRVARGIALLAIPWLQAGVAVNQAGSGAQPVQLGVVYGVTAGVSASGGGTVLLKLGNTIAKFRFWKEEIGGGLPEASCWDVGALWRVRTRMGDLGPEIAWAECTGWFDEGKRADLGRPRAQ